MWSQRVGHDKKRSTESRYSCAYPKIESLVNKQLLALNQYFSNLKVYEKITCGLFEMPSELQQVLAGARAFTFQIPMPKLLPFHPCVEQQVLCSFFVVVQSLSHVQLFHDPTDHSIAHWAPLFVGFPRQEY